MKNRNLRLVLAALSVGFVSLPAFVFSQNTAIMYNEGADIMVNSGAIVQINGGFVNDFVGKLTNDGEITVATASTDGDFHNNQGTVDGNGKIFVEGDWINDGQFTADATNSSYVELNGTDQLITGGDISHFWDLRTSGNGIKTQTLDAYVQNNLWLDQNTELATEDYGMYVENTDPTAITSTGSYSMEGFVSSKQGFLSWDMAQTQDYFFPVGSSIGTKRYRPVTIKPTSSGTSRFQVAMVNNDATNDGYDVDTKDVSLCKIDSLYYHRIIRDAGSSSADLAMDFDPSMDGKDWSSIAQWQTEWEKTGTAVVTTGTYYTNVRVSTYNNFTTEQFALAGITPETPEILGAEALCAGDLEAGIYTATGAEGNFVWTVDGGTIVGSSTGSQVNVDWSGTSTATVYLTQTNSIGCESQPASMSVNVYPLPIAGFVGDSAPFSFVLYSFNDTTIGNNGVANWQWDFGDGYTSTQQDPYHQYEGPGTYTVQLIVTNENGCVDTIFSDVTINEGLVIANTFTPNGDGVNDYFLVPASGVTEYHIQVFNRWGTLVFESDAPSVTWDGKTKAGLEVPSGTYYYIVNAKAGDNDHSSQGYVELLRDVKN